MIFPRQEHKTNTELVSDIIGIQGKLQRSGIGIHEHYHEALNEIRARLEAIEDARTKMCDEYCRLPFTVDQEELNELCKYCPMNALEEVNNYE